MNWLNLPNTDSELHDLIRSSGQKLIITIAVLYLIGHVVATLGFPQIFIPGIWGLSLYMLILVLISLVLNQRRYGRGRFGKPIESASAESGKMLQVMPGKANEVAWALS